MIRWLIGGLLLAALSGCSTISGWFGSDDTTEPPAPLVEFKPSLQVDVLWKRDVGAGSQGRYLKLVPAVYKGRVFAADRKGEVRAYGADDGKALWSTDTDAPISGGPGVGDGLVLVGTNKGDVIALDEKKGDVRWRARVTSEVLSPPQAADGIVVVRSIDGRLSGLSTSSGRRLWTYDRTVPILTLRGTSTPVIAGDVVLDGFDGGRLVAVSLREGKPLWETPITVPTGRSELDRMVDIDSSPVVVDDKVYVVTYQGRVAALDLFSGRILWQRDMSSHAGLDADGRNVYVSDDDGYVWALDRVTSASVWRQTKLKGRSITAPAHLGDYVVVGDFEGYLHWMRRDDGQFAARVRIDSAGYDAAPLAMGDTLYVYGKSGTLAALRPRASGASK